MASRHIHNIIIYIILYSIIRPRPALLAHTCTSDRGPLLFEYYHVRTLSGRDLSVKAHRGGPVEPRTDSDGNEVL